MSNSNAYMAEYMKRRYERRRDEAITRLGGACSRCGTTDRPSLRFHHRNRAEKSFTICGVLAGASQARVDAELAKCDLLCEPCHKHEHRSAARCGTNARYGRGCRCDACRAAHGEVWAKWKHKRRSRASGRAASAPVF